MISLLLAAQVMVQGDTVYLLTRSEAVSRGICTQLGDTLPAEAKPFADGGPLSRVRGCHTIQHIIVCPEGDAVCLEHEEAHRTEGEWHP